MHYDKHFARICAWLQEHGYKAVTYQGYVGAKGKCRTALYDKSTERFVRWLH